MVGAEIGGDPVPQQVGVGVAVHGDDGGSVRRQSGALVHVAAEGDVTRVDDGRAGEGVGGGHADHPAPV